MAATLEMQTKTWVGCVMGQITKCICAMQAELARLKEENVRLKAATGGAAKKQKQKQKQTGKAGRAAE